MLCGCRLAETLEIVVPQGSRVGNPARGSLLRMGAMSKTKALEYARCADINLDNLAKMMPGLTQHPFLQIVKEQIASCIKELDDEEASDEG